MIKDTIVLKSGEWTASICPRQGGNIVSLKYCGKDILNPLDDEKKFQENPYIFGSPILMPANRTYEGKFIFEGKEHYLKLNEPENNCHLHGFVVFCPFETVDVTESTVYLRIEDRECVIYPFPFALTVVYSLTEGGLLSSYEIENIGCRNMPFTFCLHTSFTEPQSFSCPIDMCLERNEKHIPTGRYIELSEKEAAYVSGSPSSGVSISGCYSLCGNTARVGEFVYGFSDGFDHLVLYNGGGESGFLCIEPMAGKVNGLNMHDGHRVIAPNGKMNFTTYISHT